MKVYDPTSSNQRIRELEKELEEFIADHNRLSDRYREYRLRASRYETVMFFSILLNIVLITAIISLAVN
jgi:hypothetical protein